MISVMINEVIKNINNEWNQWNKNECLNENEAVAAALMNGKYKVILTLYIHVLGFLALAHRDAAFILTLAPVYDHSDAVTRICNEQKIYLNVAIKIGQDKTGYIMVAIIFFERIVWNERVAFKLLILYC